METNKTTTTTTITADVQTSVYDTTLEGIGLLEAQESIRYPDEDQERICTKYQIMRISTKYFLLMSFISAFEGFEKAFLDSSANRHLFLGDDHIKVNSKSGTISEKDDDDYDEKEYPEWVKWKGCGMSIPEAAYITLAPNAIWPTIFMKTEGDGGSKEITIYERAWNADVFTSGDNLIKDKSSLDEDKDINKGITSIYPDNAKFSKISLEVQRKLDECTIVIQFPFLTTSMDVLTEVSFEGEVKDSIVLTTFS
ncbi:MAG: hypothetical protein HRT58_19420 [Crocinitomicaceae bacterium]|nr:hypothetical protein [Flavobacteriales bacterium]NQZ37840.1 hypothetical protein [Crocinitomicaceae bacterium]